MDYASSMGHFVIDVLRLALWLIVLAAVFVPLERLFSIRVERVRRAGIGTDLLYYFLSSLLPAALLALPAAVMGTALHRVLPAGWFSATAELPALAKFGLALVVAEFGAYWGHRWCHEIPLLWRFHAIHHSVQHMDWLANSRAHPFDMVFVRVCALLPLQIFGLAQASAGAQFAIAWAAVSTFWGFLVHANLSWRFGPIERLLATPFFHHWHHTRSDHIDRNYAAMFPWMDWLFGTLYLPRHWPAAYGTDTSVPAGLPAQLTAPFAKTRAITDA
jgi:sterol desaturase/sphingolipid hydroxylase (fatty acid hydroxylase superfamily)